MNLSPLHLLRSGALASASLLAAASAASASIISVNFYEFVGDTQEINVDETFGVTILGGFSTISGNWTNTRNTSVFGLPYANGNFSSVDMLTTLPNGFASFGAIWADSPIVGGIDTYTATVSPPIAEFQNLAANFPSGYVAVVYFNGFTSANAMKASISDGTTTYYFRGPTVAPTAAVFTQTTMSVDPGAGAPPVANYAVFGTKEAPLTADFVTFTVRSLTGSGVAIGGVQIIDVRAIPEPGTLALLGGAGLTGFLFLRRRRG